MNNHETDQRPDPVRVQIPDLGILLDCWSKNVPTEEQLLSNVQKIGKALEWWAKGISDELKLTLQFQIFPGRSAVTFTGAEEDLSILEKNLGTTASRMEKITPHPGTKTILDNELIAAY